MDTVTALWRVPSADFLFQAQLNTGVRTAAVLRPQPPDRLEAIRAVMANAVRGYAVRRGVRAADRRTPHLISTVRPCR
jgi:hypothetical protein